jgi:hypothetical protein
MAARVYDIYDLNSPMVTPTAPAPAAMTAQGRTLMQRLSDSLLFNASVVLGVFASIVYALGTILSATPLGQVTPAQDVFLWGGVILGALAVAGMMTAVLVATVVRVTA